MVDNPINKEFVFLDNYISVLKNTAFRKAALNTFTFSVISVPLAVILSMLLAMLLDSKIPFVSQFRTSFLCPMMVPVASVVLIWQVVFHYNGVLNDFLSNFGIEKIDWLKSDYCLVVVVVLFLLYCGFLSGSKSFVLVSAMLLLMWVFSVLKMRGRGGLKIVLLACFLWGMVYIATSAMFSSLIDVLVTRFATTRDLNSFTTGRIRLWNSYFNAIVSDVKVFFLGRGFTNIKINDRASHSTLIQIFYQFGLIGSPVLVYWIFSFYRNSRHKQKKHKPIMM